MSGFLKDKELDRRACLKAFESLKAKNVFGKDLQTRNTKRILSPFCDEGMMNYFGEIDFAKSIIL